LVVLTVDELRQVVREELAALLDAKDQNASEWLTTDDVAKVLGYRRAYVTELARRHGLPCHQPTGPRGRRMFRRSEVEAWAQQRSEVR
jgi:excisionase family DNA binding protein